ncbi:MAG: methyltransferase domain-containing protein [Candidatus Taylorbacteria bacterium]|nr:methyltransferase domain-containing protein [Candidatus Taylorbacteria bacterium]
MNRYSTLKTVDTNYYSTKNIILREISSNKTILDIGCNDGYFGRFDKGNIYYGLDYSVKALSDAKNDYKDILQYDLNNLLVLPWDIKFDTIVFADVLEHVLYPEKVLEYFSKNYLINNGKVIISLPNIANWQVRLNLLFGKFNYTDTGIMDKTHLHFYSFRSASRLIRENNLRINKVFSGASFFGPTIDIFPFLRNILATNIILICEKNEKKKIIK